MIIKTQQLVRRFLIPISESKSPRNEMFKTPKELQKHQFLSIFELKPLDKFTRQILISPLELNPLFLILNRPNFRQIGIDVIKLGNVANLSFPVSVIHSFNCQVIYFVHSGVTSYDTFHLLLSEYFREIVFGVFCSYMVKEKQGSTCIKSTQAMKVHIFNTFLSQIFEYLLGKRGKAIKQVLLTVETRRQFQFSSSLLITLTFSLNLLNTFTIFRRLTLLLLWQRDRISLLFDD